jgi:hypothetical protein
MLPACLGDAAGTISVLCSTTSLAYGVNLPARRVIIKDSFKAFDSPANRITATEYKQMSGRAGRAGIDTQGESILMVRPDGGNRQQLQALVQVRRSYFTCLGQGRVGTARCDSSTLSTSTQHSQRLSCITCQQECDRQLHMSASCSAVCLLNSATLCSALGAGPIGRMCWTSGLLDCRLDLSSLLSLWQAAYAPFRSALADELHLAHALYEIISIGQVRKLEEVEAYMTCR